MILVWIISGMAIISSLAVLAYTFNSEGGAVYFAIFSGFMLPITIFLFYLENRRKSRNIHSLEHENSELKDFVDQLNSNTNFMKAEWSTMLSELKESVKGREIEIWKEVEYAQNNFPLLNTLLTAISERTLKETRDTINK
ncbi:MAG: hypothetical protein OEZ36_08165, partial [Spirochaetota bacterium]|nr:hypothetical protein [Spirochaetota bacterium]